MAHLALRHVLPSTDAHNTNGRDRVKISRYISRFFPRPNVHVPLGSTTETRTLDGSFATLPSVPSIGTGCIVTAVVDMAGSRVEVADRPSSRPATAFRARPGTRHPTGELRSAATEKNFKMFKLSYETTTVRSDRPGERPIRGEVERSRSSAEL